MSTDLANIRMLRALGHALGDVAADCGDERNAALLARLAEAAVVAMNFLASNPPGDALEPKPEWLKDGKR